MLSREVWHNEINNVTSTLNVTQMKTGRVSLLNGVSSPADSSPTPYIRRFIRWRWWPTYLTWRLTHAASLSLPVYGIVCAFAVKDVGGRRRTLWMTHVTPNQLSFPHAVETLANSNMRAEWGVWQGVEVKSWYEHINLQANNKTTFSDSSEVKVSGVYKRLWSSQVTSRLNTSQAFISHIISCL